MNNIKKLALGLLVAAFAFGFSAFKSTNLKLDPQWVYVQTDNDEYTKIPFVNFDDSSCRNLSAIPCSFQQPETDMTDHGTVLDYETVSSISGLEASTDKGLYQP